MFSTGEEIFLLVFIYALLHSYSRRIAGKLQVVHQRNRRPFAIDTIAKSRREIAKRPQRRNIHALLQFAIDIKRELSSGPLYAYYRLLSYR